MKKFFLGVCCMSISLVGMSYAISIESFVAAIDQQTEKKGGKEKQMLFLESLHTLLISPSFTNSPYHQIFAELARYSYEKIQTLKTSTTSKIPTTEVIKTSDGTNYIHINNVDVQKVKDAVLGWHNTERSNMKVSLYSYHSDLEKSATTRAKVLRTEARTNNTHRRKSGDGYYNYASIMQWFNDLGVYFPSIGGGRTAFTESVGRGYYKCSRSDCTDSLITSIKTTRDNLIMKEKSSQGSHYRAATMSYFTQMGIGISIDATKNRYYLVLHYAIDPIEGG